MININEIKNQHVHLFWGLMAEKIVQYVGSETVTNSSGSNEGIMLQPSWALSGIKVVDLNEI